MADFSKQIIVFSLVVLASFWISGLPSKLRHPDSNQPIDVYRDHVYYRGDDFSPRKHQLDIYRPRDMKQAPVLLFVHGGSWWISDKSHYRYLGETFAARGFVTVVISYRLSPAVQHPEHVRDVARAFRWVYEHIAEFGGDPSQIFVGGHSAGAHLSALLALDDEYLAAEGLSNQLVRGVICMSGVFDLNQIKGFVDVFSSDPELRAMASPIKYVDQSQPPFLIIYAEIEFPTLASQAIEMESKLTEQGSEVVLQQIAHSAHLKLIWDIGAPGDTVTDLISTFIQNHALTGARSGN